MLNNCKEKGKKLGRIPVLPYLSSSIWALPVQISVNKFAERYEQNGITGKLP
jgi:hypothetical protein